MADPQTKDVAVKVGEQRLAPARQAEKITLEAILERAGGRRMSPEEFEMHFGDLPTDGDG